ncbi:MAG: class I SAM-dependent methyltransferase [Actinomycetota bacterium]|nr:class I SAM-dependent methyltransferase [Actinomycetota bacterium]
MTDISHGSDAGGSATGGARRVPGSFRDPTSRVFLTDELVLRALDDRGAADYAAVEAAPFFAEALAVGDIVATERFDDAASVGLDAATVVLRHERLAVTTYPYEWSFDMLRDAALLQLRLTRAALADGCLTKDASAYNVQFDGVRPVFIDVGSFEPYRAGEPWFGYRQFCQHFLNPLILQSVRGVAFQPWLRGSLEGVAPLDVLRLLRSWDWLRRRGLFAHVVLHARAEGRYADGRRDVRGEMRAAGLGPKVLDAQLRNLERTIGRLRWKPVGSTWSSYSGRSHYSDEALAAKERFVESVAADRRRGLVLDLGANDGRFSRLVADHAERVVAADVDHLVVDRLYRSLRDEGETRITPVVADLADPSPSLGWRHRERPSFVERMRPDLVLCLALVHHLAITNTVPLDEIAELLVDLGSEVVVEVPHVDDPMTQRLLATKRAELFNAYGIEAWEAAIAGRFDVAAREELPGGSRTIYHLTPRV